MFNLFKKKEPEIKVVDKVVIGETSKFPALLSEWKKDNNVAFVFWFDESLEAAASYFATQASEKITLLTAREVSNPALGGKKVIFAEHYPLKSKEEALYRKLNLNMVEVFSSLQEPLFRQLGADKIIQVMRQLGMKDDEIIDHNMISSSIRRAQEKIEKKVAIEQTAQSQADWLQKNIKA